MANITGDLSDYEYLYSDINYKELTTRLTQPGYYASEEYRRGKVQSLAQGIISDVVYAGFDHDPNPMIIPIMHEAPYDTILSLNLHYVPPQIRQNIIKFILETNKNRISNNQPIWIDWHQLTRVEPLAEGMTRRYKQMMLGVVTTYPITKWPEIIRRPSRFENVARRTRQ